MDITITLDRSEQADYIYQQIYQKLKKEILSRNLLPSLEGSLQAGAG